MAKPTSDLKRLNDLIKDIDFAMLTTVCSDGSLHSRPMATQKKDFDGTLWFFTQDDSHKTNDISGTQTVTASFVSPDSHRYVSVNGTVEVVKDQKKLQEFWDPDYLTWFPQGLEDQHLCLLKVVVDSAEYWDVSPSLTHPVENKKLRLVS